MRRLHIIDACQACDLPVSFKYERNVGSAGAAARYRDGVSFEKLFGLLQHVNKKAIDKLILLRWAILVIGVDEGELGACSQVPMHELPLGGQPSYRPLV